jgi:hypothetical protein
VGVFKDFHLWTDRPIPDAVHHPLEPFDKRHYLFKLTFLRDRVSQLNYDYFIWLDADTWFVRHPGDVLRVLSGAPVHASLESDACRPDHQRPDWWDCPLAEYAALMRAMGVRSRAIFNVNAGFWMVHHDVIETFCQLCLDFWAVSRHRGYTFTEEAPLAYATHLLCGNPYEHTLRATADVWASDWTGQFRDRLPDQQPWFFQDYFSGEQFLVSPAMVHAMRSKGALAAYGAQQPAEAQRAICTPPATGQPALSGGG